MSDRPQILELIGNQFIPVVWEYFVQLTPREVAKRPFILKAHGLYFVGDGLDTDIGKIVARKHPNKVRHLIEWLEIVLPYWTSEMMDTPLIKLPLRKINEGNASEVLARIQKLTKFHEEATC